MQKEVEQLYDALLLFVKNRIRNKEDAEDITQEVFYKLSRAQHNGIHNLKSWVYTIAKNSIIDYYRKHRVETVDVEQHFVFENEEAGTASAELSGCITTFVGMLPDEYRLVITYSELENMPQKEIAQRLDMNYVTLRSKVQRGRKKLKNLFTECCTVIQGGKGSILDYTLNQNMSDGECSSC
ncbi:sigma-70 family RNA polymerase sigma factor [Marinoscillum sp.]|uniref:sigma-70 family RNA polymerase sigma factor n=1 Tax=Marinoscillum sp. TaxID=2024838 RepID=UPI003BAAE13B